MEHASFARQRSVGVRTSTANASGIGMWLLTSAVLLPWVVPDHTCSSPGWTRTDNFAARTTRHSTPRARSPRTESGLLVRGPDWSCRTTWDGEALVFVSNQRRSSKASRTGRSPSRRCYAGGCRGKCTCSKVSPGPPRAYQRILRTAGCRTAVCCLLTPSPPSFLAYTQVGPASLLLASEASPRPTSRFHLNFARGELSDDPRRTSGFQAARMFSTGTARPGEKLLHHWRHLAASSTKTAPSGSSARAAQERRTLRCIACDGSDPHLFGATESATVAVSPLDAGPELVSVVAATSSRGPLEM